MAEETLTLGVAEASRIELKSYNTTIPMGSLSIGVDNIHHDVFLSPKFVLAARGVDVLGAEGHHHLVRMPARLLIH